ncbi:MAG: hypothetical protein O2894_11045 [Planctomycetota bacterium]|nr:hypothetical protein [Planctomycetota bacterium]
MSIEILISTTRTLGGATCAVLEQLLGPGFLNIDPPETDAFEVELTNVDAEEWGELIPDDITPVDLGEKIKANKEILRVRVPLRLGHFLLFPGFVVLCRPDDYDEFMGDPRARQIVGRESLELAHAFGAGEIIICGDAATDFLGTEATTWDDLKEVLVEEAIDHQVVTLPG